MPGRGRPPAIDQYASAKVALHDDETSQWRRLAAPLVCGSREELDGRRADRPTAGLPVPDFIVANARRGDPQHEIKDEKRWAAKVMHRLVTRLSEILV